MNIPALKIVYAAISWPALLAMAAGDLVVIVLAVLWCRDQGPWKLSPKKPEYTSQEVSYGLMASTQAFEQLGKSRIYRIKASKEPRRKATKKSRKPMRRGKRGRK